MTDIIHVLGLPFLTCLAIAAILGYLGIHVLKREMNIDWLFAKIMPDSRFIDQEYLYIGDEHDVAIVHPERARKVLTSLPNEMSLANECDVFCAHAHRFGMGLSYGGRRIGMLGGLFDPQRLHYYWRKFPIVKMMNGFFIYTPDNVMHGFADKYVNWKKYGAK